MERLVALLLLIFVAGTSFAQKNVVNVYTWTRYIPHAVLQQFEKETGIKIHLAEYDTNEILYSKIKANPHIGYDVIFPSSYYVDRMRKQKMLMPLEKSASPNRRYINPLLMNKAYDRGNHYSLPYLWGTTAIVVDKRYWDPAKIKTWGQLWESKYKNQLLLNDDTRDVFAIALRTLGYGINDTSPKHIKEAYQKLLKLKPNIRLFNTSAALSIYADNDVTIGMAQSGDIILAGRVNPNLVYIYPEDGFSIWMDCMVIPKYAPHYDNAMIFINFMTRPDIAKQVAESIGFSTPNSGALKMLPAKLRNDPTFNPPKKVLKRGQMQVDIGETIQTYQHYWQLLKL